MHRTIFIVAALSLAACKPGAEEPAPTETAVAAATEAEAEASGDDSAANSDSAEAADPTAQANTAEEGDPTAAPDNVAAAPDTAERTPSGLASVVLRAGSGTEHPSSADTVQVHYTGWTTDGEMFDSSHTRGQPATFPLNRVIPGWTEGVQLMVEGEKRRFWIPVELAYNNRPGAPAGMLVFDVELLDIEQAPEPPAVPSDVGAIPDDVEVTESGLASRVLQEGTGEEHPTAASTVQVHYTGWTTDGEMFDSSVTRGAPATFPLSGVIPGWTEGVQLMVVGEKRRFWIPVELAYNNRPGAPAGMLVFDVELLEIR